MHKKIADKWVTALRSGDYQQAKGSLKDQFREETPSYCCLGVLCDISPLGSWENDPEYGEHKYMVGDSKNDSELPGPVQAWADMKTPNGGLATLHEDDSSKETSLTDMNDGTCSNHHHSFQEIADFIEKHWEKL